MKNLSLILIAVCFSLKVTAQTNLDSLYTVWQDKTQSDSSRAASGLDYIYMGFIPRKPDSAFVLAKEFLLFAQEKQDKQAEAQAYLIQGVSLNLMDSVPEALTHFRLSLKVFEEIDNKEGIANLLKNIGSVYWRQGNQPKALDYYIRSLTITEELGDKREMAGVLHNTAMIYQQQGDLDKALEYYKRSLTFAEELNFKPGIAISIMNIGMIYKEQLNDEKAFEYFQRSLKLAEEVGNTDGITRSLISLGNVNRDKGEHAKADSLYQRSLKIQQEISDKNGMALCLLNIGINNLEARNYPQAITECQKSYQMCDEMGELMLMKESCKCLYEAYKGSGNNAKALAFHEKMVALNDSLFNDENTKKLTQLEMQYDFDKKETATQAEQEKKDAVAAQELKRQKLVRNGFMGGFAVVLLFAGVFFVQRNRIGKEKERSEELLLNILPGEVAEELKAKGHSDAQLIDHVTVLFTDFKGFTALSEQLSPKELVEDLHVCFSAFDKICEKYGIEKIKTIGDAYMAAGGLPVPNSTHAKDVAQAALEMAKVVEDGKAKKMAAGEPFFEIRIGIHTGPVVAGIVGVKKFQYDIWGDTVNTASRMESSGEVGKVNISEATYKLLKDDASFSFASRGKIEAKGKGEMEMFFVEATS